MTTQQDDMLLDAVRGALRGELQPLFGDLSRLVDRRIAELSAELHASVELVDMNEAKLSRELTLVHDQIASLVAAPTASTRNSGVELEAVVIATEAAANTIMEAAEAIQDWISGGGRDAEAIQSLAHRVNEIFEACSFQDVTGQRIRRAIQHLQNVESMLERFVPPAPQPLPGTGQSVPGTGQALERLVVATGMHTVADAARSQADMGQDDIDALLNS